MIPFDEELQRRLAAIRAEGLYRELRRVNSPQGSRIELAGRALLNFSSNDYLGLANHPALKEAATRAVAEFGAGSGASRLLCGSLAPHHELEEALAAFKQVEAALTFSTGYATALGTIPALVGKEDILILDKLVHASIVDAAKLSGATRRVFAHNDLADLENLLQWANRRDELHESPSSIVMSGTRATRPSGRKPRILIVTESVFSMDGDHAPLREIVALKEKHGAWLMVDEAHATGLYGPNRRGLAEELGVSDQIEIQMGTLGKALGASGGYICGSRALIDFLINRGRSFIFSTAPVPAAAAAATAGIRLVQSAQGETLRRNLWERVNQCRPGLAAVSQSLNDGDTRDGCTTLSTILPLIIGDEARAVELSTQLRQRGIFVPAIRYPTVARGSARLRITLSAAHSGTDVGELVGALSQIVNRKS